MDLIGLLQALADDGSLDFIMHNPLAQFGTKSRKYLGATLLPEKTVTHNKFREEGVKFRSVIANSGTRYSPVQLKGNVLTAGFDVELSYSDIGSQLKGQEYDALINMLRRFDSMQGEIGMQAMLAITGWIEATLNRPLVELNEKLRMDCLVDAQCVLVGDNGYTETVQYSDPSGHRFAAADSWADDTKDPMDDLALVADKFSEKGYVAKRCLAPRPVITALMKNEQMRKRAGTLAITGGTVVGQSARVSMAALNAIMTDNGLPPIEPYDLRYTTAEGSGYMLKRDVMLFTAETDEEMPIDLGDGELMTLENLQGYTAIGFGAGQISAGRTLFTETHRDKPPRIEGQAWQASLPVVTQPEGIIVIKDITTS